ncbi:MAG: hypothetical protein ABI321_00160 [Polyangia bacterium]
MRYLITGGAGFVGSHLGEEVLRGIVGGRELKREVDAQIHSLGAR